MHWNESQFLGNLTHKELINKCEEWRATHKTFLTKFDNLRFGRIPTHTLKLYVFSSSWQRIAATHKTLINIWRHQPESQQAGQPISNSASHQGSQRGSQPASQQTSEPPSQRGSQPDKKPSLTTHKATHKTNCRYVNTSQLINFCRMTHNVKIPLITSPQSEPQYGLKVFGPFHS